jgi:hypothetical protein
MNEKKRTMVSMLVPFLTIAVVGITVNMLTALFRPANGRAGVGTVSIAPVKEQTAEKLPRVAGCWLGSPWIIQQMTVYYDTNIDLVSVSYLPGEQPKFVTAKKRDGSLAVSFMFNPGFRGDLRWVKLDKTMLDEMAKGKLFPPLHFFTLENENEGEK